MFSECLNIFRFRKTSHVPKMSHVGYLKLATGLVLLISYKLPLSRMGSDVGKIFSDSQLTCSMASDLGLSFYIVPVNRTLCFKSGIIDTVLSKNGGNRLTS